MKGSLKLPCQFAGIRELLVLPSLPKKAGEGGDLCPHLHIHTGCVNLPDGGESPAVRHAWSPPPFLPLVPSLLSLFNPKQSQKFSS